MDLPWQDRWFLVLVTVFNCTATTLFIYFYTAVSQRRQYHGSLTQIEDSDQNTGRETGYLTG